MVPLVGGQWAETRTLVVGAVQPATLHPDGPRIHTTDLSYFSRLTDSTIFTDVALVELHQRGIERAGRVGMVVDGAMWCQSFVDLHSPEAVRILDFPHATEYITAIGQTHGPDGELLSAHTCERLCQQLKHDGPEAVLAELEAVVKAHPTLEELPRHLAYLQKRVAQLAYPTFVAAGWPIGSGVVESANKLVVEERLKGLGMYWAERNVNPILALRNAICNDRWDETWALVEYEQRRRLTKVRQVRSNKRVVATLHAAPHRAAVPSVPITEPVVVSAAPVPKPPHPWKRAWSVRRQRELADAS